MNARRLVLLLLLMPVLLCLSFASVFVCSAVQCNIVQLNAVRIHNGWTRVLKNKKMSVHHVVSEAIFGLRKMKSNIQII